MQGEDAAQLANLRIEACSLRELLRAEVERGNRRVEELRAAQQRIVEAACAQAVEAARQEWEAVAAASTQELQHTCTALGAILECQDELRNATLSAEARSRELEEMLASSSRSRGRLVRSVSVSLRPERSPRHRR